MPERLSAPARAVSPQPGRRTGAAPRAVPWLAVVCVAFVAAQLLLVVPGSGLGWDETVYTSQVSGHLPAAFFSAPRARGITFLAAPAAWLTSSTLVLRVYMALLSGVGLYLALRVWRPLLPVRVLATAGGLFAGLWITVLYGPQVMPNLWSAYGSLAAVGCFLRAARDRTDRAAPAGLVAGLTVVGLMRPPDAVWLVAALALAALTVRRWRRPALLAALVAGLLLGCAEWVIEAYVRYGGLSARLHRASEIQGGLGLHLAIDDQIRALDGRTLCRPCDVPWRHKVVSAWWFALPILAAWGAAVVPRTRRATAWLPLLAGAFLAAPYLFTIDYAAPRFLLPAYALLAIPVAECVWWPATRKGPAATAAAGATTDPAQGPEGVPRKLRGALQGRGELRDQPPTDRRPGNSRQGQGPRATDGAAAGEAGSGAEDGRAAGGAEGGATGRRRPVAGAVVVLALCGHLALQGSVLLSAARNNRELRTEYDAVAARLHAYGLRAPCLISGDSAVPIAYYTGCASRQIGGPDASITPAGVLAAARRQPVAVIVAAGQPPPAFAAAWRPAPLPARAGTSALQAYLPP